MRQLYTVIIAALTLSDTIRPAHAQVAAPPAPSAQAASPALANPLLGEWAGPFGGVPPWDIVKPELFPAAFAAALADEHREIEAISGNTQPPTFENTIAAMERAGKARDRLMRLFSVMTSNMNSTEYQALDREWKPKLAAADDAIAFDARLFKRIEAVHASAAAAGLAPDQQRLTSVLYDSFVRLGAKLDAAGKARLGEINQALAGLFSEFSAKVLADENTWTVLDSEADLASLPESLIAAAKAGAAERGLTGKWVIVNTRSSVDPFLT
ncbi:MAG TPA: hypothetical protein VE505_01770, partial [Vicinamibacterales bacterium]|nr:hypothetical protein [Vicinamibacterales bacterium]